MMRAVSDPLLTMPETAGALRTLLLTAWAERDSVVAERDRLAAERDSLAVECEAPGAAVLHRPAMWTQLPQPLLWFRQCGRRSGVPTLAYG